MVISVKKTGLVVILLIVLALQMVLTFVLCVRQLSKDVSLIDYTIVIDAGHGGMDSGKVATDGTRESDLNLQYAKTLGQMFDQSGFNVVYTRTNEGGLYGLPTKGFKLRDMQARKSIVQKCGANIVISIHMNQFGAQLSRKGPHVFYQKDFDEGQKLANALQQTFNNHTGNNHECIAGDYYMCREMPCPSVIVECGFLSNAQDLARLKTDEYRQTLCNLIFSGVMNYLCTEWTLNSSQIWGLFSLSVVDLLFLLPNYGAILHCVV